MRDLLGHILFAIAALFMSLMAISLFLQVIARETHMSVDWTEEMARFAFIAMVFIASSYTTLRGGHLRVSVLSDLLANLIGKIPMTLFHLVILIGFDIAMVWYGFLNLKDGIQFPNTSPAMGFNQNYLFLAFVLGFGLSALIHFMDMIQIKATVAREAEGGVSHE